MRIEWNDQKLKRHHDRVYREASARGFTSSELKSPYLDDLSHQTKSARILRMITLAYYLGKMKGIEEVDEGKTLVLLQER